MSCSAPAMICSMRPRRYSLERQRALIKVTWIMVSTISGFGRIKMDAQAIGDMHRPSVVGINPALAGSLAFVSDRDGENDIWVMGLQEDWAVGAPVNLTAEHAGNCENPKWSPDGSLIAFDSAGLEDSQIWVMNFDGSNKTQLTFMDGYYAKAPSWSPDGLKIAFYRRYGTSTCDAYATTEVCTMSPDGSNVACFGNTDGHGEYAPAWSPDGSKIVYARDEESCSDPSDLWTMNPDGTEKSLLYPSPGNDGLVQTLPRWNGNDKILFSERTTDGELGIVNPDGTERLTISHLEAEDVRGCCWAFNNRMIIYQASTDEQTNQLWMVTSDGDQFGQLTEGAASNHSADFRPSRVIEELIVKYYDDILDRQADPLGLEFWKSEIERIVSIGIDIKEGIIALSKFFFNAEEYVEVKNPSDEEYVTDLYQTFLNRLPGNEEINYWVALIEGGLSRNVILNFFVYSEEFGLYMTGILGAETGRPERNLVNDFYRGLLNRLPDSLGFGLYADLMAAGMETSEQAVWELSESIASSFLNSAECVLRNLDDHEFLEALYNGILRRGAMPEEFQYWLDLMDGGMVRDEVLDYFINSQEFQIRVQAIIDAMRYYYRIGFNRKTKMGGGASVSSPGPHHLSPGKTADKAPHESGVVSICPSKL